MTQANYTGSVLERFILSRLDERGYTYIPRNRFVSARILGQPIYTSKFHVGQSIYGTAQYCDFIAYHPERWPDNLIIESKWQQSGGSVDEKYRWSTDSIGHPLSNVMLDLSSHRPGIKAFVESCLVKTDFSSPFLVVV